MVASKIKDGIKIGDDAIVLGGSEVQYDIPSGRAQWLGRPAQPSNKEWKQRALAKRELPRVRKFFSALKNADSFDDLKAAFFDKK